jgi:hypothetical protein
MPIKTSNAFIEERSPGVFGWVGLNLKTSDLPRSLGVNPTIGVRHEKLESVLIELSPDLSDAPFPSITRPLGYLMPDRSFRSWVFKEGVDGNSTAREIVSAVVEYGGEFISRFSDWPTFSSEAESSGLILDHMRAKTIPIIEALNGNVDRARELVASELVKVADGEDFYSKSYRIFAQGFMEKFSLTN